MEAEALIREMGAMSISLELDGDSLVVRSAHPLSWDVRDLVRTHKPALVEFLRDAHATAEQLVAAAMLACDHFHDSKEARAQMVRECQETPPELRRDLIEHFRQTYRPGAFPQKGECTGGGGCHE